MDKNELIKKKEELKKEYEKEYEEMEYNLALGTTSDVYEYFCGILHLIERKIRKYILNCLYCRFKKNKLS